MNTFQQRLALPKKPEKLYAEVVDGPLAGRVGVVKSGHVNFAGQSVLDPVTGEPLTIVGFFDGKQYAISQSNLKKADAAHEG